jgi:hypothetical protein
LAHRKLSKAQFKTALRKGQGRALRAIRARGQLIDESTVLDACLHNFAYDPQLEGSRAWWMMAFLDAADAAERLRPKILAAFDSATSTWDLDQLCGLAEIYARRGCAEARETLYKVFERQPDPMASWLGVEQILRLDGLRGVVLAAARRPAERAFGEWRDGFVDLLESADEAFGAEAVDETVEEAARSYPRLRSFQQSLRDYRERPPPEPRQETAIGLEQVIEEIRAADPSRGRQRYRGWGKRIASEEALRQVAEAMYSESHPGRLAKYLAILSGRAPSRLHPRLLTLADHPDREVRSRALAVLANYSTEAVRALALTRMRQGDHGEEVLGLFIKNYREGDHRLIEAALLTGDNIGDVHGLVLAIRRIFENNHTAACATSMRFVYEHSPCSLCRAGTVELLLELGMLPDELREECALDANEDIREKVGNGRGLGS